MKTLLIFRHAKTQPDAPNGDHARQLTKRGLQDAAAMAAYVRSRVGTPNAIITSDARRALQTAQIVADGVVFTASPTIEPRIYGAGLETLIEVIRDLPAESDCVVLVGHNPGLEVLAAALTGQPELVRLPTSAVAHVQFETPNWTAITPGSGQLKEVATRHTIA